jgi:hypothetical protein
VSLIGNDTKCFIIASLLIVLKSGMKPSDILDMSFCCNSSEKLPRVHIATVALTYMELCHK